MENSHNSVNEVREEIISEVESYGFEMLQEDDKMKVKDYPVEISQGLIEDLNFYHSIDAKDEIINMIFDYLSRCSSLNLNSIHYTTYIYPKNQTKIVLETFNVRFTYHG